MSPPLLPTENIVTYPGKLPTANRRPFGLNTTDWGEEPLWWSGPVVPNGEFGTAVRFPLRDTVKTDTAFADESTAATSPVELNATPRPSVPPVPKGEPNTGVSSPRDATENIETVSGLKLEVPSQSPFGENATASGPRPVANGDPGTSVKADAARETDTMARQQTMPIMPIMPTRAIVGFSCGWCMGVVWRCREEGIALW